MRSNIWYEYHVWIEILTIKASISSLQYLLLRLNCDVSKAEGGGGGYQVISIFL